ncbi:hypothetical protein GGI05_006097, partial [Coemansia sp. RSA 2603]
MPALTTAVAVAEQVYAEGLCSAASSQRSSSVTTINSYITSPSETSDTEVFFGPLSASELRAMHPREHRRSTQHLTLTPLVEEEHTSARRQHAALRIQTLARGVLARRSVRRALSDLVVLSAMGSASVQRRRTVRGQPQGKEPEPEAVEVVQQVAPVVKRGRSIRSWFQRPQQPPQSPAAAPRVAVSDAKK